MAKELLVREQVPEELTWDLTSIFASDEEWEAEFKAIEALEQEAKTYKGKATESAESLYKTLQFGDRMYERFSKLYVYSHLKHDQDTTNSQYQATDSRVRSLGAKLSAVWSFLTPEILSLDEQTINDYVASYEPLQLYKQSLKENKNSI